MLLCNGTVYQQDKKYIFNKLSNQKHEPCSVETKVHNAGNNTWGINTKNEKALGLCYSKCLHQQQHSSLLTYK